MAQEAVDRLEALGARLRGQFRDLVLELIDAADLGSETAVDPESAATSVHPYTWLLNEIGSDGIPLSKAGYLPPATVSGLAAVLHLEREWIGTLNREAHTPQVYDFRQTARLLGLVRVNRGRLLTTKLGESLRDDPLGLWSHIAARLPLASHQAGYDAGALLLLIAAAQAGPEASPRVDIEPLIALGLHACGWGFGESARPATPYEVRELTDDTRTVLQRMGADDGVFPVRGHERSQAERDVGATCARTALLTWS